MGVLTILFSFPTIKFDIYLSVLRDVLNVAIFELILLMIPVALLYLYAMIASFLDWEATFEIKPGQKILSDTIKEARGTDGISLSR